MPEVLDVDLHITLADGTEVAMKRMSPETIEDIVSAISDRNNLFSVQLNHSRGGATSGPAKVVAFHFHNNFPPPGHPS